jgi:spermidine synthase
MWIIPLAIYLITFILVFAPRPLLPQKLMLRLQMYFLLPLMVLFFWGLKPVPSPLIPLHWLAFFATAMVCHGELANTRPSPVHLTEFYLWLSVGGVLGGLFNALLAPVIFNTLTEYPLMIAVACLLRPASSSGVQKANARWLDFVIPLGSALILVILVLSMSNVGLGHIMRLDDSTSELGTMIIVLISCFIAVTLFIFSERPIRFGLGIGGVILASLLWASGHSQVLYSERNFFGIVEVVLDPDGGYHLLNHGTTIHGAQSLDPARRLEPLTYYHPAGPIGQVFAAFDKKPSQNRVAVIGLGTGTLACYARPGQQWIFYEIDPAVARIAHDPRYFTFLDNCPAEVRVILGDGRLSLAQAPDRHFDLIVLDVFSSDSIPVHFLTQEALRLYLAKLSDGGILLFHISNKYLDLKPVLGDLAGRMGLACFVRDDNHWNPAKERAKKIGSVWAVMARQRSDLGRLPQDERWETLRGRAEARPWTDDFSNILSVFKWSSSKF